MLSLKGKVQRFGMILGAAALSVTLVGAVAAPAKADGWHHGWHRGGEHGWDHGWYGPRVGLGFGVYPPAYYYPPQPRVYYPPAYYGAPYYPSYGGLNVTIPIR